MVINKYQPYAKYKKVGVDLIDDIPEKWEIIRNGALFQERNKKNHPDYEPFSVSISEGVTPQGYSADEIDKSASDKSSYKVICKGDIVYNKMRMWQGAVGLAFRKGIVSPAYVVCNPRLNNINSKYFEYLYRTPLYITESGKYSYGLVDDMNSLRYESFKAMYSLLPPKSTQDAIVNFLDIETSRIDKLIKKQEGLIKLLEEKRTALISHAVTKGLDPDVEMKDSGVEWLGEIPKHWEKTKLKYLANVNMGQSPSSDKYNKKSVGLPFLQGNAEFSSLHPLPDTYCIEPNKTCSEGDILLSVRAPVGELNIADQVYGIGRGLCSISPNDSLINDFAWFLLHGVREQLYILATGSTYKAVAMDDVENMVCTLPPKIEQKEIAKYLEVNISTINKLNEKIEKSIEILHEYRTSLISAAVTGKIDVRDQD